MSDQQIKSYKLKSNGCFSLVKGPYDNKQHPNQQCGLDSYVDVLDHDTGNVNSLKLYENSKGLHFKKGCTFYLSEFTTDYLHVPFQVIDLTH